MPPEEKTNNNPQVDAYKVGIDPIFKGAPATQKNPVSQPLTPGALNVLNNQKYVPNQAPISITLDSPNINPASPKSIVRTYKGDIESAIAASHLSSINIALAETEKKRQQAETGDTPPSPTTPSEYSKSRVIIFISAILLLVGIIGIVTVILLNSQNSTPVIQVQSLPALITTEIKDEVNISLVTNGAVIKTLADKLNNSQMTVNNLANIYLTAGTSTNKRLLTAVEFASLMNFNMPPIIQRVLLPDFMVGVFSFEKNLPFIIFKTTSFENTYAGMLAWESDLEKNMSVLFHLPGYENAGSILNELAPKTQKKFFDGVIVNKDVRILKGTDNETLLLYGIIDKETVIITVSDTAFKEIINRLNKEKGLKR